MREFKGPSLRSRLYLLLLAVFIPVALLIFFTAEDQKSIEKKTIFQGVLMLSRATALEERQQLDAARDLLATLADLYVSKNMPTDQIQPLLDSIAAHTRGVAVLGMIHTDGRLIARASTTGPGRTDYGRQSWFKDSLQQKHLTYGDYHANQIEGRPVLYVALPIVDGEGQAVAVAFAALELDWINRPVVDLLTSLPVAANLTLVDNQGGVLRYDTAQKQWSQKHGLQPRVLEQIKTKQAGIITARDKDNTVQVYAFTPLESPIKADQSWVILQISEKNALAASRDVFYRNVTGLALFALLAAVCVWWSAEALILRRVRQLVRASRGIAAGDFSARVGDVGGRDELSHLAGVFDDMATALQQRQLHIQQAMTALQASQEQLRNLSSHQQDVLEKERIRIAREIHDQLGQALTILKMDLSWIKKQITEGQSALTEKIDTMFELIDDALKTMHNVMAELRPVILDDFGLAAALEWQSEEFQNRTGIACHVDIDDPPPAPSKETSIVVFRIFQELLTNIIRHAEATVVQVAFKHSHDGVLLRVSDNGRGITEAQIDNPESYGLIGIRERLHPWAGTVAFKSGDGNGTQVTVTLPLPEGSQYRD